MHAILICSGPGARIVTFSVSISERMRWHLTRKHAIHPVSWMVLQWWRRVRCSWHAWGRMGWGHDPRGRRAHAKVRWRHWRRIPTAGRMPWSLVWCRPGHSLEIGGTVRFDVFAEIRRSSRRRHSHTGDLSGAGRVQISWMHSPMRRSCSLWVVYADPGVVGKPVVAVMDVGATGGR